MTSFEFISSKAATVLSGVYDVLALRKHKLWSSALLGAVILLARYWSTSKSLEYTAFVSDPTKAARRIKVQAEEYDEGEYDVIVVGGGE